MLPDLDRALLLGGLLALASAFFGLRWGRQLVRALWRRLNVRRGLPYLTGSVSSYGTLTVVAVLGLALGSFVCFADLTMRGTGVLDREAVDLGRLSARAEGGTIEVRLEPAASSPFEIATVRLEGERWRLSGSIVYWSGLWRVFGIPSGYRIDTAEAAAGPLGRPDEWRVTRSPLLPPDARYETLRTWAERIPGVRVVPQVTDWEPPLGKPVTFVVTSAGPVFVSTDNG